MNDIDALVLLSKKGSVTGAVDLAERLWPGSHHHRKTNGAALARAAGAIMARLQKRGFVEVLRGAWRNTYLITAAGRSYLRSLHDRPGSHVGSARIYLCDRSSCMGNEEGCDSRSSQPMPAGGDSRTTVLLPGLTAVPGNVGRIPAGFGQIAAKVGSASNETAPLFSWRAIDDESYFKRHPPAC